jgi:hypothetical protein
MHVPVSDIVQHGLLLIVEIVMEWTYTLYLVARHLPVDFMYSVVGGYARGVNRAMDLKRAARCT